MTENTGPDGFECPRCESDTLSHSAAKWWEPGKHSYVCGRCGWDGFGPAPSELGGDVTLSWFSRLTAGLWRRTIGKWRGYWQ